MRGILHLFIIIVLAFGLTACSSQPGTPVLSDLNVCSELTDKQCVERGVEFQTDTPELYATCKLSGAKQNTLVKFNLLYYGKQTITIDEVIFDSKEKKGNLSLHTSLSRPYNGWPAGDYAIFVEVMDVEDSETLKLTFKII